MERRALIAVLISVAVLVLYQEVVIRRFYPPPSGRKAISSAKTIGTAPTATVARPVPEAAPKAPAKPAAQAPTEQVPVHLVTVETPLYKATFTSRGARLTSFQLKKYRTTVDPKSPLQETVVPGQNGELPFGVELRGASGNLLSDAGAPYSVSGGDLNLTRGAAGKLDFTWHKGGMTLRKEFTFRGDSYEFSVIVNVQHVPDQYNEVGLSWAKAVDEPPASGSEVVFDRAIYLNGRKLIEDPFKKLSGGQIIKATGIAWAGYAGSHFFGAMIPIEAPQYRLWLKLRDQTIEESLLFPLAGPTARQTVDLYIGPKDFDALQGLGHDLSRAVNLGWFTFIAVPLLHELKFSHQFTGNYGIDIILLTVAIKILFIPLTQRSYKSMRAMQKLQPQMAKIRERFKGDQQQMNKEIMELYRRHKVNPLGGCLPMVLQIPVFIGLYDALGNAVELRHAPFMLWINDLSAPDRLGSIQLPFVLHPGIPVLTLLMGVSMFVQQWMTPTAGDPTQQRMMMIMPLVFTFMFVNFPSGLALYWLMNNLLTIAQQYYINQTST